MNHDVLADILSVIKNQERIGRSSCATRASSLGREVLKLMQARGYIGAFELVDEAFAPQLEGFEHDLGVRRGTEARAEGLEPAAKFQDRLKLIALAASLGECHTLVTHPASITHRQYSKAEREAAGITDGLVRISVGVEHVDDLITDLTQALAKV